MARDEKTSTFALFAREVARISKTGLISAVAGAIAAIMSLAFSLLVETERSDPKDPTTLEDQVVMLSEALEDSVSIISGIEAEIAERQRIVADLEARAEAADALSKLSQEQFQAVEYILSNQLQVSNDRSFWSNVWLTAGFGFVFYILGGLTPLIVGKLRRGTSSDAGTV